MSSSGHVWPRGRYLASREVEDEAGVVLLGAPLDVTVSFRPGTRFAPTRVREVSEVLESYSPELDRDLAEVPFYDAGDIDLPPGSVGGALERIEAAVLDVVAAERFPLLVGGEHLITLPSVRAVASQHRDLAVVQFDAHADLRADYLGEEDSHATVMRRVAEVVGAENVYQIGIRSGTREEFQYGRRYTRFFPFELSAGVERVLAELRDRPVYVTVDIDVVDPGLAPGVGTPEPGGCTPAELLAALRRLKELPVVGADVVELCPPADAGTATAVLVAKVLREMILAWGTNPPV